MRGNIPGHTRSEGSQHTYLSWKNGWIPYVNHWCSASLVPPVPVANSFIEVPAEAAELFVGEDGMAVRR